MNVRKAGPQSLQLTPHWCIVKEIAEFSYDEDRNIHLDARSLAYYYPPPDDPDGPPFLYLDRGLESFRRTDDSVDEHLVGLLAAIMEMEKKQNAKIDTHFISYRGMMTNVSAINVNLNLLVNISADYHLRSCLRWGSPGWMNG